MPDISHLVRRNLTETQANAALDLHPEVLCLACAGSGKSETLAHRIAYLVSCGTPPASLVAITFTEKAAESIKRRVAYVLTRTGQSANLIGQMFIGTIHSYCHSVLAAADALYRQYDVLDGNRFQLFLMSRFGTLGIAPLRARFNDRYFESLRAVAAAWNLARDEGVALQEVRARDEELGACLVAIDAELQRSQYLDFSSMIRLVCDGAHASPEIQRQLAQVSHLLVDEYQDVSGSQEELIRIIRGGGASIFVVGDDDQSIYGWRGAHVSNILDFEGRYPGAHRHVLDVNFRSTRAIVESANQFAMQELGAMRLPKNPSAWRDKEPRHLGVLFFQTRDEEATWVGDRIQALLGMEFEERDGTRRGLTPGDFAILMRSTRTAERDGSPRHAAFTQALNIRNIRYTLAAGGSVFDRPQVNGLRAVFDLLAQGNPDREVSVMLFRNDLLPAFPGAVEGAILQVVASWGRRIHAPRGGARQRLFPQELLLDLLDALRVGANFPADDVMRDLGLFSRMLQDVESVYPSVDSAARFQNICTFLHHVAEGGYDVETDDVGVTPDAIVVSTVHQAKGLEYPVVFIVDVEAQRFPGRRGQYRGLIPQELIQVALQRGAYASTPESEARLFYTALTRAERCLYVTGAVELPGGQRQNRQSSFARRLADAELVSVSNEMPRNLRRADPAARHNDASLPTSFTDIKYYLSCPMDYRFRKGFSFSPSVPELFGYGRVVHVAVEKLHERFIRQPPDVEQAAAITRENFHLKHVQPSRDPDERPGPYEQALDRAEEIVRQYVQTFGADFTRHRQVEARFEIPAEDCLITGSIDLLLRYDNNEEIVGAEVLDFKTIEGGADPAINPALQWTELSLQVQLYAHAAREVMGEAAVAGGIHFLKDNQRIAVPIDADAVQSAMLNIEWAVAGILAQQYPMRPSPEKCRRCDFNRICPKVEQALVGDAPPPIHTPAGRVLAPAIR